jgi:hypothetical protein
MAEVQVKTAAESKAKRHKKNVQFPDISLKKHQASPSLNDVSYFLSHFFDHVVVIGLEFLFFQPLIQRFLALGTECLEFRTAANESKGKQPYPLCDVVVFYT